MPITKINGAMFAEMVKSGAVNLDKNRQIVNELNVFPVPDGDTGDNMAMTILSIKNNREIFDPAGIQKVSSLIMNEVLLGARGNSGVILSRIFAGINKGLDKKVEVTVSEFDYAMRCGVDEAYSAVAEPVEGTILTVLRDSVKNAGEKVEDSTSFESYFENLVDAMNESVKRTPELLPALRNAGVVDSGGAGLYYIFEGMRDYLLGKTEKIDFEDKSNICDNFDMSLFTEDSELEFGYCTEFLLRLQNQKINTKNFDLDEFIVFLKAVGDSVVAFRDGTIVKVHVHTKTPGKVLTHCQEFGEFLKLKIENMTLQHNGAIIKNNAEPEWESMRKKFGIVTVAVGDGLIETFKELGCDVVINGGQSMNPSTNDFLEAFKKVNAETIFVFPNNKNVIMTAKQAAEIYKEAKIIVVETKNIGDGYVAISMIDFDFESTEEIVKNLDGVISETTTGQISKASRTIKQDDVEVVEGDYIGFSGGKIYLNEKNREAATLGLLEKLEAEKSDIIILISGDDVELSEMDKLKQEIRKRYIRSEVFSIKGGQPVYDYIIILE